MNFEQFKPLDDSFTCLLMAAAAKGNYSSTSALIDIKAALTSLTNEDFRKTLENAVSELDYRRAEEEFHEAKNRKFKVITLLHKDYPRILREVPDPPACLFIRGALPSVQAAVAIVGTRRCSSYGARWAFELAKRITERGGILVSGLANGIDAAAHRGGIEGFNRRQKQMEQASPGIAVLGGGLAARMVNRHLSEALIESGGALISEYGVLTTAKPYFFPRRNRIISGLSSATIVIEAGERSGAIITAKLAAEQGREVWALPGPIDSPVSIGTHRLIDDGARVLHTPEACLKELGFGVSAEETLGQTPSGVSTYETAIRTLDLSSEHKALCLQIVKKLRHQTETSLEALMEITASDAGELFSLLSQLELHNIVRLLPGNRYCLGSLLTEDKILSM